jgi:hypothetical protein
MATGILAGRLGEVEWCGYGGSGVDRRAYADKSCWGKEGEDGCSFGSFGWEVISSFSRKV